MTRAIVLRAAGTNCDRETVLALERAGAQTELLHLNRVIAEPQRLDDVALVVIAGGFSHGDDIAAGRIFGLDVRYRLGNALRSFADRGGAILGVCNGFQVLVDTGLLEPGHERAQREVALTGNDPGLYQCRWVTLKEEDCACTWLEPGQLLPCPIAHGEGRIAVKDPAILERWIQNRQVALRYVARDGSPANGYPENPNGSIADIAGLCDPTGRILGLMPHPERNIDPWQDPEWTRHEPRAEGAGLSFYRRLVEFAESGSTHPAPTH